MGFKYWCWANFKKWHLTTTILNVSFYLRTQRAMVTTSQKKKKIQEGLVKVSQCVHGKLVYLAFHAYILL